MSLFHSHDWREVAHEFNPPVSRSIKVEGGTAENARQLLYGITNIREQCAGCGATRVVTVAGKVPLVEDAR